MSCLGHRVSGLGSWGRFPYGVEHVLRQNGIETGRGFDAVLRGGI